MPSFYTFFVEPQKYDPEATVTMHSQKSRIGNTDWTLMSPKCTMEVPACTIYMHAWYVPGLRSVLNIHRSQDASEGAIIRHIIDDLGDWLRSDSAAPVKVAQILKAKLGDGDDFAIPSPATIYTKASLDHISSTVAEVAQQQKEHCERRFQHMWGTDTLGVHLIWADRDGHGSSPVYPEPDLLSLCEEAYLGGPAAAVISLMRSPQYTDATGDMIFERYLKAPVSLLLEDRVHFLSQTDCTEVAGHPGATGRRPLVVACGCTDFSDEIQEAMAAFAGSLLGEIVTTHVKRSGEEHSSLPPFCFVYGIHWSISRVRILLHYPSFDVKTNSWTYVQVVLAEHMHGWSLRDSISDRAAVETLDDAFLHRWRLTVALFAIRAHTQRLEEWMNSHNEGTTSSAGVSSAHVNISVPPGSSREDTKREPPALTAATGEEDILTSMRGVWSGNLPHVPNGWLGCLLTSEDAFDEATAPLIGQLLEVALDASPHLSSLLSSDPHPGTMVVDGTLQPDFAVEPDLPRMRYVFLAREAEDEYREILWNTHLHQLKLYDILSMQVSTWSDINIFIASMFSGVRGYELEWRPASQNLTVALDFRLVLRQAPVLFEFGRSPESLIALPSAAQPVIFLGLRSRDMHTDGSTLTPADQDILCEFASPYIQVLRKYFKLSGDAGSRPWHFFCTYLTAGYVHIIAFPIHNNSEANTTVATPIPRVLDSLPITMRLGESVTFEGRVRVFFALATLQHSIVRFAMARAESEAHRECAAFEVAQQVNLETKPEPEQIREDDDRSDSDDDSGLNDEDIDRRDLVENWVGTAS